MGYKNLPVMSIEEFYEDRARKVDNIQDLKVLSTKILGWSTVLMSALISPGTLHFFCVLLEIPEFFKNVCNKCCCFYHDLRYYASAEEVWVQKTFYLDGFLWCERVNSNLECYLTKGLVRQTCSSKSSKLYHWRSGRLWTWRPSSRYVYRMEEYRVSHGKMYFYLPTL